MSRPLSKGVKSVFDSCIKLIRDTADLPHHSAVISIVERVKQEIGRNRNFKKRIHELTRNLNKSQRQTLRKECGMLSIIIAREEVEHV